MKIKLKHGFFGVFWVLLSVMTSMQAGCGGPKRVIGLSDLESPHPTVQIRAAKWAGDNGVPEAVGKLVDMLEDEDRAVRFYAIGSLRRITGEDYGYDYKASAASRAEAVKRWRKEGFGHGK